MKLGLLFLASIAQSKLSLTSHEANTRISMMEKSPLFDDWRRELTEIYDPNPLRVSFFGLLHQIFGPEGAGFAYQDIARREQLPMTPINTYEDNINWLHELLLDENRIQMIQKIEQLPMTPIHTYEENINW